MAWTFVIVVGGLLVFGVVLLLSLRTTDRHDIDELRAQLTDLADEVWQLRESRREEAREKVLGAPLRADSPPTIEADAPTDDDAGRVPPSGPLSTIHVPIGYKRPPVPATDPEAPAIDPNPNTVPAIERRGSSRWVEDAAGNWTYNPKGSA